MIDTHLQLARLGEGDEVACALSSAEEGVKRLRRTLEQMMTLARADAPADRADACASVAASVRSVLDSWRAEHTQRLRLNIRGEDLGTPVPRSMLQTAVRNLVDNALRYSPPDAAVEVDVALDQGARRCLIAVSDRGPGLSAEQASRIGQRFWRGDQGRKSQDGAGLGISIVRAIAERFGGALQLKPRKAGGLVAELSLPLSK